jgi:hypothetical protein
MILSNGRKLSLTTKLFSLADLVPSGILAFESVTTAGKLFVEDRFMQLISKRQIKKNHIERFFTKRKGHMGVLVKTVSTLRQDIFRRLKWCRTKSRSISPNVWAMPACSLAMARWSRLIWPLKKPLHHFRSPRPVAGLQL